MFVEHSVIMTTLIFGRYVVKKPKTETYRVRGSLIIRLQVKIHQFNIIVLEFDGLVYSNGGNYECDKGQHHQTKVCNELKCAR